jgi:hypothetical protein
MDFLTPIPAFIRILIVFAVILVSIHRKLSLGHCFSLGAFFLGILFVCLLLSNEYFETSLDQVYGRLIVPCLVMVIAAVIDLQVLI